MVTREELHELLDHLPDEEFEAAAAFLRQLAQRAGEGTKPPWPKSVGSITGPADLSQNVDKYLAEGFGE